jgi:SAM-dependent methyltransferase
MARIGPFERYSQRYDNWFERNKAIYESEILAIKELLPDNGYGVEIGVGTGRFALPLGIRVGVEPSPRMAQVAQERGINVVGGIAEALPFSDSSFDFVLMVTTICFVDDVDSAFNEVHRVLRPGGCFLNGSVDMDSPLGQFYEQRRASSPFYAEATFHSTKEMLGSLQKAGFKDFVCRQTLFHPPNKLREIERPRPGYGEGSFVVIKALE